MGMFLILSCKLLFNLLILSWKDVLVVASPILQNTSSVNTFLHDTSLDVNLNIGITLTHGGSVFDLGSTNSQIKSKKDSCNILKIVRSYSDGGSGSLRDTELVETSIIELLAQKLCSEEDNQTGSSTINKKVASHPYTLTLPI